MILHLDLILLLNISCILIFATKNPISSALWLIVSFLCSSIILWLFNAEFFALLYIIIYVGAIAVLFLFVIMMLEIKNLDFFNILTFYGSNWYLKLTILLIYIIPAFFFINFMSYFYIFNKLSFEEIYFSNIYDVITNLQIFGQIIYNYYIVCILIAGLVLLVAIIGAITLTFNYNNNIIKNSSRKLSRSDNFLSFFK